MSDESQDQDDNNNAGTNSAPANTNSSAVPVPEYSGNKQKSSNKTTDDNPDSTNIRRWNPLSKLSSYTYNLTLYIVTPDCANYFAFNNKLDPQGGWYIVAQSGGISNDAEPRAITVQGDLGPGKPGLDYYIDDLNMEIFLVGVDGRTSTAATTLTFKVIEPTGFTFLTKLRKVSDQINKISKLITSGAITTKPNLYQQHYMIGIKFYGYDASGNIIESSSFPESNTTLNDKYAIYERIIPIITTRVAFKIDGKTSIYNFEATASNLQSAFGTKRGFVFGNAQLEGSTVGELLGNTEVVNNTNSLIGWLNDNQRVLQLQEKQQLAQTYSIDWGGLDEIRNSPMVIDSDYEQESSGNSNVQTVEESNPQAALKAITINKNSVIRGISPNTPIVSIIDQIITKSSYITDKLNKKINSQIEAETKDDTSGYLQWYAINPVTKVIGRDEKSNDWAYDITYQILPFQIPYVRSQYVSGRSKYYGPVKKYSYTLTGENTEVINFELDYNNLFYVSSPQTATKDNSGAKNPVGAPIVTTPSDSNATGGGLNKSNDIVNQVRANIYSIGDQALATIKIIGDPDLIMTSIGAKIPQGAENLKKFYGIDGSISPYNGQVFIEIIFKVAEDYLNNGLLDVDSNQEVAFYPTEVQNIIKNQGLIFKIKSVKSTFARGKFEQVLDLYMVPPSQLIMPSNENDGSNDRSESARLNNYKPKNISEGGGRGSDAYGAIDPRRLDLNNTSNSDNRQSDINLEDFRPSLSNISPASSDDSSTDSSNNPLQNAPVTITTQTGSTQDDDANVGSSSNYRPTRSGNRGVNPPPEN